MCAGGNGSVLTAPCLLNKGRAPHEADEEREEAEEQFPSVPAASEARAAGGTEGVGSEIRVAAAGAGARLIHGKTSRGDEKRNFFCKCRAGLLDGAG